MLFGTPSLLSFQFFVIVFYTCIILFISYTEQTMGYKLTHNSLGYLSCTLSLITNTDFVLLFIYLAGYFYYLSEINIVDVYGR